MNLFPRSLRWRLQWWLAFLLISVLSGFGVTVYQLRRIQELNKIDAALERRVAALTTGFRRAPPPDNGLGRRGGESGAGPRGFNGFNVPANPPPRGRAGGPRGGPRPPAPPPPRLFEMTPAISNLFEAGETESYYFAVWGRDGGLLGQSSNAPPELTIPERMPRDTGVETRTQGTLREVYHFTDPGECVLAGGSLTMEMEALRRFAWRLAAAGGAVLALGLGGAGWITARAIRPLEEMSATARRISAGNLSERISGGETEDELGRLAGVLNSAFAKLEGAFARQKQFTADAAHELRTPITVLITEAQGTLARERTAEEYRESAQACLETAAQMRRLTNSLLELAAADAGSDQIQRQPIDLAALALACAEQLRPLAAERRIVIRTDLARSIVLSHAERMRQVITNLLDNAISYNLPSGDILIASRSENGEAQLRVTDTGIGIEAADLPHVFERFYRTDKARSRAHGHSGLGLAICKAIVEAEGGSISVSSVFGRGSVFTVRLKSGG